MWLFKQRALLKINRSTVPSVLATLILGNVYHPSNVVVKVVQMAKTTIFLLQEKGRRINIQRCKETYFLITNTGKNFNGYQLIKG